MESKAATLKFPFKRITQNLSVDHRQNLSDYCENLWRLIPEGGALLKIYLYAFLENPDIDAVCPDLCVITIKNIFLSCGVQTDKVRNGDITPSSHWIESELHRTFGPSNGIFNPVDTNSWQSYLRLIYFLQQYFNANGLPMFNLCPEFKLVPFHVTLSKTMALRTKTFGTKGKQSRANFESIFDMSILGEKITFDEFYTDLYSTSIPYHRQSSDYKSKLRSSQPVPAQTITPVQSTSKHRFAEADIAPGIEISPAQVEAAPQDFLTFEPVSSKRKARSDQPTSVEKRPRTSLSQKYQQGEDCPGDEDDLEDERILEYNDEHEDAYDEAAELDDAHDALYEEPDDDEDAIGQFGDQTRGRDYSWLNNPTFPQINIADQDTVYVGVDVGVVFMGVSSLVRATAKANALEVLESTERNDIQSVMLKSTDFRARIRAELSQTDRELAEDVYAEPRYCFDLEMAKRKSSNAAIVTNERMPLYLDQSVQKAKYSKFLARRSILREYAARLVGLESFDHTKKENIIVFWGTGGMKRFHNRYLPGRKCHPASKELLHYVQMIATVYVTHEKGTSVHCSNCEQRVVRRRTADQDIVTCAHCHLVINGDVNAAVNILKIGLIMATNRGRFPMQFTL
ncbi:hypothetical protein MIR68_010344 [Amoeboaphelidium protococcarum]|nr:hypothetical protein MIR68_010344 [Amoeboaphelidium protococcarum]